MAVSALLLVGWSQFLRSLLFFDPVNALDLVRMACVVEVSVRNIETSKSSARV
jgi:hypothetical protein